MLQIVPIRRTMRPVVASIIAFWITGAGCMLGCTSGSPALVSASGELSLLAAKRPDVCVSTKSHSCCAKSGGPKINTRPPTFVNDAALLSYTSGAITVCPLSVRALVLGVKSRGDETFTTTACTNYSASSNPAIRKRTRVFPLRDFPNRGDTHLRCCVFLI